MRCLAMLPAVCGGLPAKYQPRLSSSKYRSEQIAFRSAFRRVECHSPCAQRLPRKKKRDVLTIEFTVVGVSCIGLNGGPAFKHNEAFSFQIATTIRKIRTAIGTSSLVMVAMKARAAGARTRGAFPGKSRRAYRPRRWRPPAMGNLDLRRFPG